METNNLAEVNIRHEATDGSWAGDWRSHELAQIIRLRLVSDPGFPLWDVSYCLGLLKDGRQVRVRLPFRQLPKRGYIKEILRHANRHHIYLKSLVPEGDINGIISFCQ